MILCFATEHFEKHTVCTEIDGKNRGVSDLYNGIENRKNDMFGRISRKE